LETHFELNDTLYARATIDAEDTDEVYLWLGANVMLAYPTDEAETMLEEKLRAAQSSLDNCEEDLEFLREQITVCASLSGRKSSIQKSAVVLRVLFNRHWKWPLPASTTGMLCKRGKRRVKGKVMTRRRVDRMANIYTNIDSVAWFFFFFFLCLFLRKAYSCGRLRGAFLFDLVSIIATFPAKPI
jgi:hypothetical protein